jgi:hypothetical protein
MKTNKSRRIKRQSRFRNTRNKRKSLKRQRGGQEDLTDQSTDKALDKKFNEYNLFVIDKYIRREDDATVTFNFEGKDYIGKIGRSSNDNELMIHDITRQQTNGLTHRDAADDDAYAKLISSLGAGEGNFITIKLPSLYWSYHWSGKKKAAKEIMNTLKIIETPQPAQIKPNRRQAIHRVVEQARASAQSPTSPSRYERYV